jgi:plastocyanin
VTGTVQVSDSAEAQRTVVYIETAPAAVFTPQTSVARLSQRGAVFNPGVLAVVQGSRVDMTNDDWVAHNVFSKSDAKAFDLGVYARDKAKVITFDKAGTVPIACSIHPRMNGAILVLQNPFFTKPDPNGRFTLDAVPAGTYQLRLFRKDAPVARVTVTVPASGIVEARFP